ncbi:hypothetical protein ACPTKU_12175 [Enterococcus faecalis]
MVGFGKKNYGIPKPSGTPLTIDKTITTINSLKHLFYTGKPVL